MADHLPVHLGHQRNAQLPARAQGVDDELLGMAAVRSVPECGLGERMEGGVIINGFGTDGVVHGVMLACVRVA